MHGTSPTDATIQALVRKKVEMFGLLALGGGGILPLLFGMIANQFESSKIVPAAYVKMFYISSCLLIFISCLSYYMGTTNYDKNPRQAMAFLYISAIASIGCLHFIVLSTGGPIQSCFAYHYLYIPAVTAITFNSLLEPLCAAGLSAISFGVNLFGIDHTWATFNPSRDWQVITASTAYKVSFAVIFALQMFFMMKMHLINLRTMADLETAKEGLCEHADA